jgi:hypothetical protein
MRFKSNMIVGQQPTKVSTNSLLSSLDTRREPQGHVAPSETLPSTNHTYQTYIFQPSHYITLQEVLEGRCVAPFVKDSVSKLMQGHGAVDEISEFKCIVYSSLAQAPHLWVMLEWKEGDLEIICLSEVETDGSCNSLMHSAMGKRSCAEGKSWIHSSIGWNISDWSALRSLFLASQHVMISQQGQRLEVGADPDSGMPGSVERYALNIDSTLISG